MMMARRLPGWRALVALALLGAACGEQTERVGQPATEPASTVAVTGAPTTTTLAPLTAGPVAEWGGAVVSTVCITTNESYPQVPEFRYPFGEWAATLLNPVGVSTVGQADPCDASLTVNISLEALSGTYGANQTLYTGHHQDMTLTLEAGGQPPIAVSFPESIEPGQYAMSSEPTTPQAYFEKRSREIAARLLDAVVRYWGPAIAVEALCAPQQEYPAPNFAFLAEQVLLDASGTRDYSLDTPRPNDYPSWRHWFETGEIVVGQNLTTCR